MDFAGPLCRLPTSVSVIISAAAFALAHLTPGEFPQLFVLGKHLKIYIIPIIMASESNFCPLKKKTLGKLYLQWRCLPQLHDDDGAKEGEVSFAMQRESLRVGKTVIGF